jgi:type I restriction enzyme S subunit
LKEIGKFKSGTGFTEKEQGGKEGIPFYKVSDMNLITNEEYMNISNNYVTHEQIKRLKFKVVKEKAIIFAKVGAAIFLERKRLAENFLIDNNIMAFIPNENISYVRHYFNTIRLSKYAQVGALPSYNASDLETIKIQIPCIEEQTKIANFLSRIDSKIEQTKQQLDSTKEFKKALLQQMFV